MNTANNKNNQMKREDKCRSNEEKTTKHTQCKQYYMAHCTYPDAKAKQMQ